MGTVCTGACYWRPAPHPSLEAPPPVTPVTISDAWCAGASLPPAAMGCWLVRHISQIYMDLNTQRPVQHSPQPLKRVRGQNTIIRRRAPAAASCEKRPWL